MITGVRAETRLDGRGDLAAVHVGHAEVGDDDVERPCRGFAAAAVKASMPACPPLAVVIDVPVAPSVSLQRLDQQRIVVDQQDAQPLRDHCGLAMRTVEANAGV